MGKDDSTWLNIAYVFFFIAVAYAGNRAIETVGVQYGWIERYDWFTTLDIVGGIIIGALVVFWLRSSAERREYHLSAVSELKKVTWPTFEDTKQKTIVVAVVVFIFAIILALFDMLWSMILQTLI